MARACSGAAGWPGGPRFACVTTGTFVSICRARPLSATKKHFVRCQLLAKRLCRIAALRAPRSLRMRLREPKRSLRGRHSALVARRPLSVQQSRVCVVCSAPRRSAMGKAVKSIEFSDASLQILHVLHEVGDHAPSVILTVGDERMCFNCAEGFQRCSHEAQVRTVQQSHERRSPPGLELAHVERRRSDRGPRAAGRVDRVACITPLKGSAAHHSRALHLL